MYRLIRGFLPESESEDDQRGEDDGGDDVEKAANLAVTVIGEREEELAAARPGHRVRVAAEPLGNVIIKLRDSHNSTRFDCYLR